jgi:hypothetical protein
LPSAAREALIEALDDPAGPCTFVPLARLVAEALQLLQRTEVPDFARQWINTPEHAKAWPTIENTLTDKNFSIIVFDVY